LREQLERITGNMFMQPLVFSELQLAVITRFGLLLRPRDRATYLERVVEVLRGHDKIRDDTVQYAAQEAVATFEVTETE
jgi:hypothetical protein